MFSYYLQDRSYYFANDDQVVEHLKELNKIISVSDGYDHFYKQKDFEKCPYNNRLTIKDFLNSSATSQYLQNRVIPVIMQRIKTIDQGFSDLASMDNYCIKTSNAFLGPMFILPSDRLLSNYDEYQQFRLYYTTKNINGGNFEKCCKIVLKNVIVESYAIKSVKSLGKESSQIFDDLMALDHYVSNHWKQGAFNEADVQAKENLIISDESDTTKQNPKYKNKRLFNISTLGSKYCFLHIKAGKGKRFHIYPDENERKVYVPYIGPHLPTPKNH